ncbi:serine hydrolase domain-containing protein [Subtercola lobariae]|uniref:Esterase n=1 Tax=Subtercola lobariae TaxID=1588641 RepID=A0A917B0L4_9MICO|nr:serine hydrolase domain-containing protein [Subtercola lobariae]GGF11520.1 esterase [Subtercola lobariae]
MTARANSYDYALDWVKRSVETGPLPVAVFGAATSTGIQEIAAFGTDEGRRAAVDDTFALFSVTKPLVGLAAMRAVERGQLSLNAQLAQAVPSLAATAAGQVTLEQLLSHTSGLAESPLDAPDPRALLEQASVIFPPGTMTQYCNLGFVGVEKLLEQATGVSLAEHIAAFNDLDGVNTLELSTGAGRDAHRVHGTEAAGLDFDQMARVVHPAAGAYATASDLLALGSALLRTSTERSSAVVHPATLDAMRVNRTAGLPRLNSRPNDPLEQDWGLAFNLQKSSALLEHTFYGHGGWSGCQLSIYPEHDACLVLMTNILDLPDLGVRTDELHNAFVTGLH